MLKAISGLLKPKQGDILFAGQSISGKPAQTIVKLGISHVPEGRRVFSNMSVEENLELGAFLRKDKQGIQEDFKKYTNYSPACMNAASSWQVPYPVENSKCLQWGAL